MSATVSTPILRRSVDRQASFASRCSVVRAKQTTESFSRFDLFADILRMFDWFNQLVAQALVWSLSVIMKEELTHCITQRIFAE